MRWSAARTPDDNPVTDHSDDPNDPTDVDGDPDDPTDDDNNPDDSTGFSFASVTGEKQVMNTIHASSGIQGNFDVTYLFTVTNDGSTPLDSVSISDDLVTQFGGSFIGIVSSPVITASTATDNPGLNTLFDGGATNAQIFDSSPSMLDVGQSVSVQFTVEVDPDNPTAVYDFVTGDGNGDLENQGTVTGTDPETGELVSDLTDDPTNPTDDDGVREDGDDDDGDPDDPTGSFIASMFLQKAQFGSAAASVTGPAGNVDLVYDFTITNTGNDRLTNLSIVEDFASQFGGAFVQVNVGPTIVSSTATDNPEINSSFNGSSVTEVFDNTGLNTNELASGESVTIRIGVEMNPFSPTANVVNGEYLNSAVASASSLGGGDVVTVISDDPNDPSNRDIDNDNNPDDPTAVSETDLTGFLPSNIGGFVYSDANDNGQFDSGESGIFGVEIILTGTDLFGNSIMSSVFTDASGSYTFVDVNPGDYTITEILPTQFLDGTETVGSLGGIASNDSFSVTIQPGSNDGTGYNFGERGLRPEFISKAQLLASSASDSSSFMPTPDGPIGFSNPVAANASSIRSTTTGETLSAIVQEIRQTAMQSQLASEAFDRISASSEETANAQSDQLFGNNATLPYTLDITDNVVTAVGTVGDDAIELILGSQTHLLVMAGNTFEFDALAIDTFHIGGAQGHNSIHIVGTDLDDTASAMDDRGNFVSSGYSVSTYGFSDMHFDGRGGEDYTQIYGSSERDILQGLPQDSTLTLPDSSMRMVGFERVDAFGRGGDDYAEVYGSDHEDIYATFDSYQVLQGESFLQRMQGFARVDAYGRGGHDTANIFDTELDDHFYVFAEYSVMQSIHHTSRVQGFEHTKAESIYGGDDKVYFRDIVSADEVFAIANYASINGHQRSVSVRDFDSLETEVKKDESPSFDLRVTNFAIKSKS